MKKGTVAKQLGYALMRKCRIPFLNQKGNVVANHQLNDTIKTKYLKSWDEFNKYFRVDVKGDAPHAKELADALNASASAKRASSEKAILSNSASAMSKAPSSSSSSSSFDRDFHNNDNKF